MVRDFTWQYNDETRQRLEINLTEGNPVADTGDTILVSRGSDFNESLRHKNDIYGCNFLSGGEQVTPYDVDNQRWNSGIRNFYRVVQKWFRVLGVADEFSHGHLTPPDASFYSVPVSGDVYGGWTATTRNVTVTSGSTYQDEIALSWLATDTDWPFCPLNRGSVNNDASNNNPVTTGIYVKGAEDSRAQVLDFAFTGTTTGTVYLSNPIKPYTDDGTYIVFYNDLFIPKIPVVPVWQYDNQICRYSVAVEHQILESFKAQHPTADIADFINGRWYCAKYSNLWDDGETDPVPAFTASGCNNTSCPVYVAQDQSQSTLLRDIPQMWLNRGLYSKDVTTDISTSGNGTFCGLLCALGISELNALAHILSGPDSIEQAGGWLYKKVGDEFYNAKAANIALNAGNDESDTFTLLANVLQADADKIADRERAWLSQYDLEDVNHSDNLLALDAAGSVEVAGGRINIGAGDTTDAVGLPTTPPVQRMKPRVFALRTGFSGAGTVGDDKKEMRYTVYDASQTLTVNGSEYLYNLKIELARFGLFVDGTYQTDSGYSAADFVKLSGQKVYAVGDNGDGTYNIDWMPKVYTSKYIETAEFATTETGTYTNPGNVVMPALSACTTHDTDPHEITFGEYGAMPSDIIRVNTSSGELVMMIVSCTSAGGVAYPSGVAPLNRMVLGGGVTQYAQNNYDKTDRTVVKVMQGNISWLSTVAVDGEEAANLCDIEQSITISQYNSPTVEVYDLAGAATDLTASIQFVDYAGGKIYVNTASLPSSGWVKVSDIQVADTRRTYAIESVNALEGAVDGLVDNGWIRSDFDFSDNFVVQLFPCTVVGGLLFACEYLETFDVPVSNFDQHSFGGVTASDDYNKWIRARVRYDRRSESGVLFTRTNNLDGVVKISSATETIFEVGDNVEILGTGGTNVNCVVTDITINAEPSVLISFEGYDDGPLPPVLSLVRIDKRQPVVRPTESDIVHKYVVGLPSTPALYTINIADYEVAEEDIKWVLAKANTPRNAEQFVVGPQGRQSGFRPRTDYMFYKDVNKNSNVASSEIKSLYANVSCPAEQAEVAGESLHFWYPNPDDGNETIFANFSTVGSRAEEETLLDIIQAVPNNDENFLPTSGKKINIVSAGIVYKDVTTTYGGLVVDGQVFSELYEVKSFSNFNQGGTLTFDGSEYTGAINLTSPAKAALDALNETGGWKAGLLTSYSDWRIDYTGANPQIPSRLAVNTRMVYLENRGYPDINIGDIISYAGVYAILTRSYLQMQSDQAFTVDSAYVQIDKDNLKKIKLHTNHSKVVEMGSLKEPTSPNVTGPEE